MRKRILRFAAALLMLCICLEPLSAHALGTVDVAQKCSLRLEYSHSGIGFENLKIEIYRVAEVFTDGDYSLIAPFDQFPVKIHGVETQKEWRDAANTLAAYIDADRITPTRTGKTDGSGIVSFHGLKTGLYLVKGLQVQEEEGTYGFENFCIFLPTPADGVQNYDVYAKPKSIFTPKEEEPEVAEFKVVKLWKDSGSRSSRPKNVSVDILKNGTLWKSVTLNQDNSWSYSWSAEKDGSSWSVVEKNVPSRYTVVISRSAGVFTVTNTAKTMKDDVPKTGDTFPLRPWLMTMCISGLFLMVAGIGSKRRSR